MPWPTVAVNTTNLDANADSPLSARSDILDLTTKFNDLIAMRGVANGVASLDVTGKVPLGQLPAFRGVLVRGTSQSITGSNAVNVLTLNTEFYDTDAMHGTSQPSRIVIPNGVTRVQFFGGVEALIADGDSVKLNLARNGSIGNVNPSAGHTGKGTSFSTDYFQFSSPPMDVTAGDYFELFFSYSGAANTTTIDQGTYLGARIIE